MSPTDQTLIALWNSNKPINHVAQLMNRGRRWCTDRAELLRARGVRMVDKRFQQRATLDAQDEHEATLLTLWAAFEYETNADEIRSHRRYRNNTQRARRMLSVALYELGFSNKQIAYWIGKRGAGQHTSAVYWRNEATESERLDAMKAIGQSNLPFRRTRAALARQADLEGANND